MTGRPTPARGALRGVRGALLAVTSGGLAVAAHTVGGGHPPDTAVAVVLTVLLAGAGTALADRRRGPIAILAALGCSQLALHVLLTALSDHTSPHSGATGAPGTATTAVDPLVMTVAHAVAALGTGLLLATAESALFALLAAVSLLLPRRPRPLPAAGPLRPARPVPIVVDPVVDVLFRRVLARRGPPLLPA